MTGRLRKVGIVLAIFGLVFMAGGAMPPSRSRRAIARWTPSAPRRTCALTYNDEGQLVDRGETAGAQAIMALLTEDWGYPVVTGELDPNDPVVDTASEYMYQMATVAYHTLHGDADRRPR